MVRTAELRRKLGEAHEAAQAVLAGATRESRALNTEEQARFDKASADIAALAKTIEAEERMLELGSKLDRSLASPTEPKDEKAELRSLWTQALVHGPEALEPEQRNRLRSEFRPLIGGEERAQSVGTNSAGGYTVPQDFWNAVIGALKEFGGVFGVANVLQTDNGRTLPIPTNNDTGNVAALLAENTAASDADATFAQVSLGAYKWTTGQIKVSNELLQDTAVDIEGFIRNAMITRLDRGWNASFTTGTGSSQPQGVVVGSAAGPTTAGAAAVTSDEVLDLIHSVDPAYRRRARLMFNDTTLKYLLKLKDSNNLPLFQPSYRDAAPATIHGYPFTINQDMASMAASAKFMLFGDFSNYWIRVVRALDIKRLVERYAEADQVAYVGFARMDAKVINAGTNPIKHMVNAAS